MCLFRKEPVWEQHRGLSDSVLIQEHRGLRPVRGGAPSGGLLARRLSAAVGWGGPDWGAADGVAAGQGSDGSLGGHGGRGDEPRGSFAARGSWTTDHMSEMSLSGRDSIPQDGSRNARVKRAVRISSIVAQEVSYWCASVTRGNLIIRVPH
ncbi:hypothetical protein DPEC_G00076180 [Dallia pectoralis]|uniref:Uncharacterized protein n=1 Tax=Dallia pectoralis TaxID=75939 RepID=A0ACC2H3C5_DALPE|nr:hypothetical protein DPEC_G00076180 [Dallia pectoralis]